MEGNLFKRLRFYRKELQSRWRLYQITRQVAKKAEAKPDGKPVVFFNASTRLGYISLNASFASLLGWGFRLSGIPVVHFACQEGMSRCVLGTEPEFAKDPPPCKICVPLSKRLYAKSNVRWFGYKEETKLAEQIKDLDVAGLSKVKYRGLPLGEIVLPSIRWRMRRHHLNDDDTTRLIFREFILSAYRVGQEFTTLLDEENPLAVVVFNGMFFPEAIARYLAEQRGIPVVSHETGYQPYTGFFTTGDATARLIDIPDDYQLNEAQNARLDAYLLQRFKGQFTMAGIQFWPEMRGLDEAFVEKAKRFKQVVPVFTNVIFDTSQPHADKVFGNMFDWLDEVLKIVKAHPETLFVIRAHPDEMRPGKESHETVRQWVEKNKVSELPNVVYVDAEEFLSSYALIQRSKFVMIYNSSIGLEGTLMGAAVVAGGEAWYMHYPTVFFPKTPKEFNERVEEFLAAEKIWVPTEFRHHARRLLYYQHYRLALPFDKFLEDHVVQGFVWFKPFDINDLKLENSLSVRAVWEGIRRNRFVITLERDRD